MSRIGRAFGRRFREHLAEINARDREKGVEWLFRKAEAERRALGLTQGQALTAQAIGLARKVNRFKHRKRQQDPALPRIVCDAGLGGLARWLRACGCETFWTQDIGDADLVREAEKLGAVIITTDSFLLDRRQIVQGEVQALWVPPSITKLEQLELVRAELDLPAADSRCMSCGGELIPVEKESVRERIPPRTYLWVNDYFQCEQCGQLFWHGTHWQRITDRLKQPEGRVTSP